MEPFPAFTENGVTNQPLQSEQSAFAAPLAGFFSDQQATAKLSKTYSDLVLKPGVD